MNFDEATGWLVGEPNKGMRAMFTMMNEERLAVGIQGLGLAEASYQGAVAYARDRIQGRSLSGIKAPDKPADPDHPSSRCAAHAADHPRQHRGLPRPGQPGWPINSMWPSMASKNRSVRTPTISSP